MRCKCCNKILSDADTRRKNRFGEYEDMCIGCLKLSYIPLEEEEQDDEEVKNKLKEVDLEQPREAVVTAPAIAEQQGLKVTMETWLFLYLIVVVLLLFNLFYIRSIAVSLHQLVKLQLVELKL